MDLEYRIATILSAEWMEGTSISFQGIPYDHEFSEGYVTLKMTSPLLTISKHILFTRSVC